MNFMKCDILLFQGNEFISRLIRWGTKSRYSHVGVCLSSDELIEAVVKGVRRIKAEDLENKAFDVYRVKEEFNKEGVTDFLKKKVGSKYDIPGVIFLGLLKLLHMFGVRVLSNKWQKKEDYFCSELCYEAYNKGGGIDIVPNITAAEITSPADIAKSPRIKKISGDIAYNKKQLLIFDYALYLIAALFYALVIFLVFK